MTNGRLVLWVLAAALSGCRREGITYYRASKEAPLAATAEPSRPEAATPSEAVASSSNGLAWTVPAGWSEKPASGMRLATFEAGRGAEVSVVALPGTAGGNLANVNRWRGQIGLEPLDEAGLDAASKRVASPAGKVLVVDFKGAAPGGEASRVVGGMIAAGEKTWFFKLTGGDGSVGSAKPAFLRFLGSLKPA